MDEQLQELYFELADQQNARFHDAVAQHAITLGARATTRHDGIKYVTTLDCMSKEAKFAIPTIVESCHVFIEPSERVQNYYLLVTITTENEYIIADIDRASFEHVDLHILYYENRRMNRTKMCKDMVNIVKMTRNDFTTCKKVRVILLTEPKP